MRPVTYAERRAIIGAFTPLIDYLENSDSVPGDQIVSHILESFDAEGEFVVWEKALDQRSTDFLIETHWEHESK